MSYGQIVLATNTVGFFPAAIRLFTGSKFSHSLVLTPPILDIPMGIEAVEGGVDSVRFDKNYINDTTQGYEIWEIKIDLSIKDAAIKTVLSELQTPYGYLEYLFFLWRRINYWLGRDIKSQDNWFSKGIICSQLCVDYLNACGLSQVLNGYGKGSICPQDLQDIMIAHPELFEKVESVRL